MRAFLHEYGLIIGTIICVTALICLAIVFSRDTGDKENGEIVKMMSNVDSTMEEIEDNRQPVKFFGE